MNAAPDTIRVVIPLTIRRRNGRPRILPPDDIDCTDAGPAQDPHVIRALARAWSWRRKLDKGEISTIQDIATAEQISDRYVSRVLRLAYLAPTVLERLLVHRRRSALSIKDLTAAAEHPWFAQGKIVFD
jgi:hypothetical protein